MTTSHNARLAGFTAFETPLAIWLLVKGVAVRSAGPEAIETCP